jgi:hypothetical protein
MLVWSYYVTGHLDFFERPRGGDHFDCDEERRHVDPYAYLAYSLSAIVNGHPNSRLDELLPWTYPAAAPLRHVA